MKFAEPERRPNGITLTPLIDVVFLLIVFFMLASTFATFQTVPVSGGTAGAATGKTDDVVLVHVAQGGALRVNGSPVEPDGLVARLDELAASGRTRAVVRTGPQTDVQALVGALDLMRSSKLATVTVVK